jgi:myo-inositol 2-dehydrogenase/D-chiro-inositol 1-dehydrogenase
LNKEIDLDKTKNLKFGVIGVGRIGKIHIENLAHRIPGNEVTAIADVFEDELQNVARQYNISMAVQDYKEIIENPEIDAVVICSPTDTHSQIIQQSAIAGKNVFCEKPVDLSLEKIAKTIKVTEDACVKFQVGFNRRFDPNFFQVYKTVKAGKIGKPQVLKITSRDPAPPPLDYLKISGGMFLDMTIHDFDMARYLMDSEVVEVYTSGKVLVDPVFEQAGDVDTAITILKFETGAIGTIDNSRQAVYGYDQRVEVFGSEGMVTVKNNTPDNHIYLNREGTHSALPLNFFMDRYTESYLKEMEAFIDCIRNDQLPSVSGRDGLLSVIIGMAAKQSCQENRPVKLSEIYDFKN